jgi:hypothetical protein
MNVHLEMISGAKVRDAGGAIAGRLHDVHAEWRGEECIVTHYTLAANLIAYILLQLGSRRQQTIVVPWDRMDFSDPDRPRLTCGVQDLGVTSA